MSIAKAIKKLCLYIWNKIKWIFRFPPPGPATTLLLSIALLLVIVWVLYMNMETVIGSLEYLSNQRLNNKCCNMYLSNTKISIGIKYWV